VRRLAVRAVGREHRAGSWLSALSFGRDNRMLGFAVVFAILFGGSFLAWLSGLFG
jgi:hypothetical protein